MEYRVEELAAATELGVDTIRFYQGRGLIDPPRRRGRVAWYDEAHAARLHRIRALKEQGFKLAQIRRVLEREAEGAPADPLLAALERARAGTRSLTREELAREAGVPETLVSAAISGGVIEPLGSEGEERFGESDLEMLRAGRLLLETGFPLVRLLDESTRHASHVRRLCDAAIDLFDDHVRKGGPDAGDPAAISETFQRLLPVATRLVAQHFQRTLVARALDRLERTLERRDLDAARAALGEAQLEVDVSWR